LSLTVPIQFDAERAPSARRLVARVSYHRLSFRASLLFEVARLEPLALLRVTLRPALLNIYEHFYLALTGVDLTGGKILHGFADGRAEHLIAVCPFHGNARAA
jgi:hypothetical protein